MPLVRLEVRNEFGLGNPELYAQANKEDPKAVLDGVAVAGLVGILRQLGDLAEFAAEVFHGLQEQVMTTSSRSHKLMVRVRNIEAALPPLEKVVLAQTSHIHFAYTAGSEWHPRIRNERNHFIYKDLPRFVMDSYEECRDPPRLHLLDKFDTGGPGSCLKRYSDPTFFKRASVTSYEPNAGKVQKERKARRSKKKRSSKRCGDVYCGASISCTHNSSMQFMSPIVDGINSPQTASTENVANNCDFGDHSNSFGSRTESGFVECVFYPSSSMQPEEQEHKESSSKLVQHNEPLDYNFSDELVGFVDDNFLRESLQDEITSALSCVTWDEKAEIFEPKDEDSGTVESKKLQPESLMDLHFGDAMGFRIVDQMECNLTDESILPPISSMDQVNESESETDNYMDALNTIESESENDVECQTKREVDEFNCDVTNEETGGIHELDVHCVDIHPPLFDSHIASNIFLDKEMPADIGKSVLSENLACEQIPASYISSNNKIPADLLDSICSEGHAFKQISPMARESFNVESSESLHESADICNDSKLEADIDEQIAASYISSNNKLPADLPDSNCLESRAFKQISHIAKESSDFGSSESIHESSDICNDSKLQADIDEQIPASYISSNNEIPADLPDSICLEGHSFKQISHIARESTDVGTYESIHESSDICNDSKLQADIDEQIPASYISSNNEIPSDLPDSICLEGHAFKQISHIARESTDVGTYESIHESSDICKDSKLQADVDEQIPASYISSNNKIPADLPDSICLEGHAFKQISYIARTCSDIESSEPIHEITDICNDSKLELHIDDPSSSQLISTNVRDPSSSQLISTNVRDPSSSQLISTNVRDPSADKIASSSLEPQEVLDDLSCKHPIRFWTNGGLLGLEPSKPPDFTKLNDRTQDSVGRNKAETESSSNCWHILKDEGGERKLNNMAESTICDSSSKYMPSCHHDQQNSSSYKMSMGFSSAKLNSKYGNYGDLPMHNGYSNASGTDMKETTVPGPRMVLPEATGDKSNSSEPNLGNCELPSLVFGLRQRLLSNSFGRKVSNINGDDHIPVISENALEQISDYQKAPERPCEEQFGCAMSKDSLTSSPPLEHMKISFHPVDSFETSKLKLKFSDVNQSPEGIDDPFPSFQLIPEPALPLHDMASDSDDDTFCRSSPYMSEDHLSHHSHSDSEQWESEESPNVKDHEGYDALCAISAECISTSLELDGVPSSGICYLGGTRNAFSGNGTLLSLSDPILDLPGFDAMKPPLERETKDDSDPNLLDYGCIGNPSPALPPLPPVQWCVSKHSSYGTENKDLTSEGFNVLVANNLGSTTIQQPELPEKQQTNEEPIILIPKAELQLKSFEQKDTNQTLNSRRVDEGEDFLQQIRTKSFNLRRTVTAKSTITPGPPANVKVTAILEKADAIRRAVGSDDGEDDNSWSDT